MYVEEPTYSAIIFRENLTDLQLAEGLIERSHDWWDGTNARWNGGTYTWRFPSGATISFGYMSSPTHHFRYKSSEYQFIAFDQVEDIRERQFIYMFSRLRRMRGLERIPLRMWATANPGGKEWVFNRFVNERTQVPGTVFIPATIDDNLANLDDLYIESLRRLDPVTFKQLRFGDWLVKKAGEYFDRTWWEFVAALPAFKTDVEGHPIERWRAVRYWDLASTRKRVDNEPAWTAGALMCTKDNVDVYLADMIRLRGSPKTVEDVVVATAALDSLTFPWLEIYMEQEPGSSGVNTIDYYARLLAGYAFYPDKVTGSKVDRAGPFSAYSQRRHVYIVQGSWNHPFISEAEAFPESDFRDQVDSAGGAFNMLMRLKKKPKAR